jgi:hypothetical protein
VKKSVSTSADWADTFSALAPLALVARAVAVAAQPSVGAALAVQPVAASAAAVAQPAAEGAVGRPLAAAAVALASPPVAAAAVLLEPRLGVSAAVLPASLRPLAESLVCPAPARSAARSGFARPAACRLHPVQAAHLADWADPARLA